MKPSARPGRYTSGVLSALSLAAVLSASACSPAVVSAAGGGKTAAPAPAPAPMPKYSSPLAVRLATTHIVTAPALTAYPWAKDQTNGVDPYGMTMRQCVSYVAWYLNSHGTPFGRFTQGPKGIGTFGNAAGWDAAAVKAGFTVSTTPLVGSVAQWHANESIKWDTANGGWASMTAGSQGHVAIVTRVYPNGNVDLAQFNMGDARSFSTMTNVRAPRYIYVPLSSPRVP
jgi:surface antigen